APHELKDLLDDLWQWLDDTQESNAFARAFAFHFIAVAIHPFADGNGRSVRLMQHLLLLKGGETIARFVPSETVIMKLRDRYYASIRQARTLNSLHPMVEFLANCFASSAEDVVSDGKALLKNSAGKTPGARHLKILALAKKQGSITISDVIAIFPDVPRRTIERDLETLTKQHALKAHGEKKARTYTRTQQ
ncbi:MAG: Fic family protein, partial [Deltaproteobacteria bacterium]|nr:Fic family protein [Deltaproteobacteria bacterium]